MQAAYTFWIIGLPSSGKTTLASSVCEELGLIHLDSDETRSFLIPNPCFKQEETEFVYRSLIFTSNILNNKGHNVIISATAHLKKYRTLASATIGNCRNIYIECPIDVCESRDVKGLYKNSRNGSIKSLPIKIIGKNDDYVKKHYKEVDVYELPEQFDLLINSSILSVEESAILLKEYIKKTLNSV
ncbi:MAG: adenylyl-sulfate kinase [Prevotellaceae bacterium]|jgi:adenylylsulfate kinase|nr:adenylyl-sulfate kinase [Prevotellaceae bacterium]